MKIRPAGSMMDICESMGRVEEVADLAALRAYIKKNFAFWQPADDNIEIRHWGLDARIWWDAYLITINGNAALFSDGPFDDEQFPPLERLRTRAARIPSDTLLGPLLEILEDYEHTFALRHRADRRAIERWRAAAPGRELTLPDQADLCVWLMDQLDAVLTPGTPAHSKGNGDATISDGSADHGEALAPGVDPPRA